MRPDIDAILARAEAATKPPWYPVEFADDWLLALEPRYDATFVMSGDLDNDLDAAQKEMNARFSAAAREDIPALCQYVRELEAKVTELETDLSVWQEKHHDDRG